MAAVRVRLTEGGWLAVEQGSGLLRLGPSATHLASAAVTSELGAGRPLHRTSLGRAYQRASATCGAERRPRAVRGAARAVRLFRS